MSSLATGVFPCYENQFKIGAAGSETPATSIANCLEFSVTFDNGVEEWNAFEGEGWKSRFMTAKSVTISVKAKRTVGDAGNDMVAELALKNGKEVEKNFLWTFPSGASALFANAVISVTNNGTGATTDVAPLEFQVMSNGKPTYTPAS
jgi:hypothetical protein